MIEAFNKYKAAGFACVPTGKDKMPAIPEGESWLGGWLNPSEYEKCHGIGIVCGKFSGGLECIDIDNHFGDAKELYQKFVGDPEVSDIVTKYKLPLEKTVGGGFHFFYRCDTVEGNLKLAYRWTVDDKGKPKRDILIETRGEGGYIVCDPTPGYKFYSDPLVGDILNPPVITPDERKVLLSSARSLNEVSKPTPKSEHEDTGRPGDIYNRTPEAADEFKSELKRAGWTELSGNRWRRPGKDKGISATFGKVAPGIFYVFTSTGYPFESEKAYTPFQGVALLRYNGDFKQFAKELHEKQGPIVKPMDFEQFRVDLTAEPTPAPALLYLRYKDKFIPSFTLQNFSLITGKAKSRKTFLTVLLAASYLGYNNSIIEADPDRKGTVLVVDTEQSPYHLHRMMKRICRLIGIDNPQRLQAYGLKTLGPREKTAFIEYKLKTTPDISLVVIDGVRDLVFDINSPEEATKTSVQLMKWCADHNLHIINVLHQNKGDANARGHLGTELVNKAETVLTVNLDGDEAVSTVESEYSREQNFAPFSFTINDSSLPEICDTPEEEKTVKRIEPNLIPADTHYEVLQLVFKEHRNRKYKETWESIKLGFANNRVYFGENKAKMFLTYYLNEGWVSYNEKNKMYKYERAIF